MHTMTPRQRVLAALAHQPVDRVPRFEVWIDAFVAEFGFADTAAAHVAFGQDGVLLPSQPLPGSNAWRTGVDEFGCVWRDGNYVDGVIDTHADLQRCSPPPTRAAECFDPAAIADVRRRYPDHCHFFGTHVGPFQAAYLAMGMARFMLRLADDPDFVTALLAARTDWAIALFQQAVRLGAEVIVVGDDAGHRHGPLISPTMWQRLVLPCHRRIVDSLPVPVIWHSDGDITALLPFAAEAGFAGVHGLEPGAGIDLAAIKQRFGAEMALLGNVDVRLLCGNSADAVRADVARSLRAGAPGGGFLLSSCNSVFAGMSPALVQAFFAAQDELIEREG
ncbi:MAG: uroporphyrinogen decarboxylase family protein [Caldilinea sp.]